MIKFNARNEVLEISSNHDIFKDFKVVDNGRLLRIPALCEHFTKKT